MTGTRSINSRQTGADTPASCAPATGTSAAFARSRAGTTRRCGRSSPGTVACPMRLTMPQVTETSSLASCVCSMSSELTKSRCGYRVRRRSSSVTRCCERAPVTFESVRSHGHNLRAARQGYVDCSAPSQRSRLSTSWCLTVRSCWVAEVRPCGLPRLERVASVRNSRATASLCLMCSRSRARLTTGPRPASTAVLGHQAAEVADERRELVGHAPLQAARRGAEDRERVEVVTRPLGADGGTRRS